MEDFIDKLFKEDNVDFSEYYPGSKRKRRAPSAEPVKKLRKTTEEDSLLSKPVVKILPNGNTIELFSAGALSEALNRPLVTLRLWERKGYIPRAPYRLRSVVVDGVKKPGWRMYSRDMIDSVLTSFQSRNLLEATRVEWNQHRDLSVEILENWTKIHHEETKPKN
jgi:hypothetical protein